MLGVKNDGLPIFCQSQEITDQLTVQPAKLLRAAAKRGPMGDQVTSADTGTDSAGGCWSFK